MRQDLGSMAMARFLQLEVSAARRCTCRRGWQKHSGAGIEFMAWLGGDGSWCWSGRGARG